MAPGPAETDQWYQVVGPSIGITLTAILAFVAAYFRKAAEPEQTPATPASSVVAKAIGAAFVDDTTQAAILRIDVNLAAIATVVKDKADRDHDLEIATRAAEEVERRLAAKRKEGL